MCVRNNRGFTVLEVLLTMAILAVLTTVAIPAYSSFQYKGNRATAFDKLQELAAKEERYYSRNGTYSNKEQDLGFASNGWQTSDDGRYRYQITNASTTSFAAVAEAIGDQADDSIWRFRLRSDGKKHHKIDSSSSWTSGWED